MPPPEVDRVVDREPSCPARMSRARPANSMPTTASRSARVVEAPARWRPTSVTTLRRPEPLDRVGVDGRVAVRNHEPNVRRVASLSITKAVPPAPHHPGQLAEPGLAAGAEEVGPPGLRDVRRGRPHRQPLGRTFRDLLGGDRGRPRRQSAGAPPGDRGEARCGSTPVHRARVRRPAREVEAGAAPEVEHGRAGPVPSSGPRGSPARRGRRGRTRGSQLVDPGGARCWGSAPRRGGAGSPPAQMRTTPVGVLNWAATTPGTPCASTHATSTSSSGTVDRRRRATRDPVAGRRRSRARRGGPAVGAAALGCSLAGALPLQEERQLRVGLHALDADLLPLELEAVGPEPRARARRAAEPRLDRGDVVDGDDPAEPAAAERGAGAHRLAERRLVRGRVVEHRDHLHVGAAAQRQHEVAGAEPGVDAAVDERPPRWSPRRRAVSTSSFLLTAYETWSKRIPAFSPPGVSHVTPGGGGARGSCAAGRAGEE